MKNRRLAFLVVLFVVQANFAQLKLPQLFADHMVLQQGGYVTFWGEAKPNDEVKIKTTWNAATSIVADGEGKWLTSIKSAEAGGPHEIIVSTADTSTTLKDVYLGEVWLASGQSNMEMPLKGWPPHDTINYSSKELTEASDYPLIRMFTVQKAMDLVPQKHVVGEWLVSTTQNAHIFSASAYFFARALQQELGVPIGIIHSSWGGTPAEAWTSKESLLELGDFNAVYEQLKEVPHEMASLTEWLSQFPHVDIAPDAPNDIYKSLDFKDAEAASLNLDDSAWDEVQLPNTWENTQIGEFDGVIWFRKEVLVDKIESGAYRLSLGPIDDMDVTYVNGVKVGEVLEDGFWQKKREYSIPEGVIKTGKNVIAVKVLDVRGGGGIYGNYKDLNLITPSKEKIMLAGDWKYLPSSEYRNNRFYLFGIEGSKYMEKPKVSVFISPNTPSILYNAMIAPITSYTIKGTIWYQGESNVGRAAQYARLFPALINDWRTKFGKNMPFYFVQIAPYKYGGDGIFSAALRDAQRKTMSLPHTGMVVTMDIGNVNNIHPGNKQDVGKRLALWALADTYNHNIVPSGPLFDEVVFVKHTRANKVLVKFKYADSGLTTKGEGLTGFEVSQDGITFYPVEAKIQNGGVLIATKKVKQIKYVRYAWKNDATATLFNKEGLPASSFTTKEDK